MSSKSQLSRRQVLKLTAAALFGLFAVPKLVRPFLKQTGPIHHILPTVSHSQFVIKTSFYRPQKALQIRVSGANQVQAIVGQQTDSKGRFWMFSAAHLAPDTEYTLQIENGSGPVGDAWPLKTFPALDAHPDSMNLLCYTCAGGPSGISLPGGKEFFKPHHIRQSIFDTALAMKPDAAIAIGDHIYWDLRGSDSVTLRAGMIGQIITWYLKQMFGVFDRTAEIIGTPNEDVLTAIGDDQIADLYGTRFKSVPMFFVADDHDYFENDDADLGTFPPDSFSRRAHAAMARLYYPAFIAEQSTVLADDEGTNIEAYNRSFGTLRFGDLVEAPMLDCAGYLSVEGDQSVLFPRSVEDWLKSKIASEQTQHLAIIPSHPLAWTAGKWREWYPDVVAPSKTFAGLVGNNLMANVQGVLSAKAQKAVWQKGWWLQHQRLIEAIDRNQLRPTIILSGDIHALGAKSIHGSGDIDLSKRPIQSLLVGSVSTSTLAWPSAARSIPAASPEWLQTSDDVETREDNGFTMIKFSRTAVAATLVNCGGGPQGLGSAPSSVSKDLPMELNQDAAVAKTTIILS